MSVQNPRGRRFVLHASQHHRNTAKSTQKRTEMSIETHSNASRNAIKRMLQTESSCSLKIVSTNQADIRKELVKL